MPFPGSFTETPWDQKVFGFATWEAEKIDESALAELDKHPGHFTIKIDPLVSKEPLHRHGFYYCDTLLEPYVDRSRFIAFLADRAGIDLMPSKEAVLRISHGAFRHGRFHRDFNLDPVLADLRYDQWTSQLCDEGKVFGLTYDNQLAAFFGYRLNKLVLHAVAENFQGHGLAKFLWSRACYELFDRGHDELYSSVSASNLAIVNLYSSLGFRFRNPIDVYHRMVR